MDGGSTIDEDLVIQMGKWVTALFGDQLFRLFGSVTPAVCACNKVANSLLGLNNNTAECMSSMCLEVIPAGSSSALASAAVLVSVGVSITPAMTIGG